MQRITIGDRAVGPGEPTYVIAEAGSNHNGDFATARQLIDAAVDAGADAVKFQTFRADEMYPEESGKIGTTETDAYSVFKGLEMPREWIPDLVDHAGDRGISFLSSPFDRASADLLEAQVPAYKVASTLVTHHPLLEYLAGKSKPLIVSTGANTLNDVDRMMNILSTRGARELALLQCVSAYPAPISEINVSVLETFRSRYGVLAGLSDHTEDPVVAPTVAVAVGADIIEKHVTLDKSQDGPDHSFALEPDQLANMVRVVRDAESAVGDGRKEVLNIERETYENGRRCLHAARDIMEGETLADDDVVILRPGANPRGIEPFRLHDAIGHRVLHDIPKGSSISYDDLAG